MNSWSFGLPEIIVILLALLFFVVVPVGFVACLVMFISKRGKNSKRSQSQRDQGR